MRCDATRGWSDSSTWPIRESSSTSTRPPGDRKDPSMPEAGVKTTEILVVLNKSDHEALLVDPESLAFLARIPTGQGPHEAAVTPDGRSVFVANYGMTGVFREGQRQDHPGNTLSVIDLATRAVRDTFDLGEDTRPPGMAASPHRKPLLVTSQGPPAT